MIEAAKAAIIVIREVTGFTKRRRAVQAKASTGGPTLRQLTFNWQAQDKYPELNNVKIEVRHILNEQF